MLTMQENGTPALPMNTPPPKTPSLETLRDLLTAKGLPTKLIQATDIQSATDLLAGRTTEADYVVGFNGRASRLERRTPAAESPTSHGDAIAAAIRAIAEATKPQAAQLDPAALDSINERLAALEAQPSHTIRFQIGENTPGPAIKDARPELTEIVRRVAAGFRNVWLSGPAGSGKTTLAETLAEATGRAFGAQSFSADTTAAALIGSPNAAGVWQEPAFVTAYESGGVYLLDEIDAADPTVIVTINAALANGRLFIPRHNDSARRIIHRHADTVIACAANTWGTGPDSMYVGRAQLDAAFLSRFAGAQFLIGYDPAIERAVCPDTNTREILQQIRADIQTHRIRRVMGTRELAAAGRLHAAGYLIHDIVDALLVAWTAEERAKTRQTK